jgi:hypothetical protein
MDAGEGDPLGGCNVTPAGYGQMLALLSTLAGGKVVMVMEGGYSLKTLSRSWAACARVLRGEAPTPTQRPVADSRQWRAANEAIWKTRKAHAAFWSALQEPNLPTRKRTSVEIQTKQETDNEPAAEDEPEAEVTAEEVPDPTPGMRAAAGEPGPDGAPALASATRPCPK